MKKFNSFFKAFVLVLIASFVGVFNVNAKSGETLVIDRKSYIQTGVGSRVEAKFHTTMGYGWCITPHKTGAEQGTTLYFAKEETDGGILYLLDNSGTSDMDYLKTQLALWMYESNYVPDAYVQNSNSAVVQAARSLANTASKYKNHKVYPSISIGNPSITVSLVKIGDKYYYRSEAITVSLANADTYTVSLTNAPSGTQVITTNGLAAGTLKKGEQFMIRIPEESVSGNVTVNFKVNTTGVRRYVERYSPNNSALQDVALVRTENVPTSANGSLNIVPSKRVCQFFNGRYYGSNGSIVTEQEYKKQCTHICTQYNGQYYGSNGTVVTEQEYKDQCLKICRIEDGKYYGSNGTVVTEQEYRNQCLKICRIEDGKYYGSNGTVVTEQEYKNQCLPKTTVVVPNTGSYSDSANLVVGSLLILGGLGVTFGYRKQKNK